MKWDAARHRGHVGTLIGLGEDRVGNHGMACGERASRLAGKRRVNLVRRLRAVSFRRQTLGLAHPEERFALHVRAQQHSAGCGKKINREGAGEHGLSRSR